MRVSRLFVLLVAVPTLLGVVGCSAAPVETYNGSKTKKKKDDTDDETTGDDSGDTETESQPQPQTETPPAEPTEPATTGPVTQDQIPPAGQCSTPTNRKLCVGCCVGGSAQAANGFAACACESPGVCAAECGATFCAGKTPSAACSTCMNNRALQCEEAATGGSSFNLQQLQCLVTCF